MMLLVIIKRLIVAIGLIAFFGFAIQVIYTKADNSPPTEKYKP